MGIGKSALAAFLLIQSGQALAAAPEDFYSVAPAACIPTGQTSSLSLLFNSAAEASIRDGGSGEVILTCAVPSTLARAKSITVRYKDDGVRGGGSRIVFALRRKSYVFNGTTGDRDSSTETVAQIDTDAFVPPVVSPQGYRDNQKNLMPNNGAMSFDHRRFFYYIQINMTRPAASSGPVTVAYVQLF